MISLDTNVIVRFLVNDDKKQAALVKSIFTEAENKGGSFLITSTVLLELIYVLDSVYNYARNEIVKAIKAMTEMSIIIFDNNKAVHNLISESANTGIELEDLLIGLIARESGCFTTLTFDKRAAKSDLFELIN